MSPAALAPQRVGGPLGARDLPGRKASAASTTRSRSPEGLSVPLDTERSQDRHSHASSVRPCLPPVNSTVAALLPQP